MNKPINVLHIISGGDTGGAKTHVLDLQKNLSKKTNSSVVTFINATFYKEFVAANQDITLFEQSNRFDLSVISKLINYINEREITIIHCHGARANFLGSFLKILKRKIPVITTIHSDYELDDFTGHKLFTYLYRTMNKFCIKRLDYYIGVSKAFKKMLVDRKIGTNQTVFEVYNGQDFHIKPDITLTRNEFLTAHNVPVIENEIIVGIMGRLDPVKGHDVFIKTAEHILKQNKNYRFLIAGDGASRASLELLANVTGFKDRIHFLGWIDKHFNFYNSIDINTVTSHSESFPYIILEASRLKKPTVSTDVGGVSDIIISGETGLLAKDNDYITIASHIISLGSNNVYRTKLGEALYDFSKNNFSVEKLALDHLDIYNRVINTKKAFVIGYYGSDNTGDDILLDSTINMIKECSQPVEISVLTYNKEQIEKKHNVKAVGRNKFFSIIREIRKSDVLIGGGGSMLQNVTSNRSLIYYLALFNLGHFYKKKIMLLGNGFGPLSGNFFRKITKSLLDKVDVLLIRDEKSKELLEEIGVENNLKVTCDIAYNLPHNINLNCELKKTVVISLRPWHYTDEFLKEIAKFADYLIKGNYTVEFIPMQYPEDVDICKRAQSFIKENESSKIISPNIDSIKDSIECCSYVVGMRLHTLILAGIYETPMIGIEYDPKVAAYLSEMEQLNVGIVDNFKAGKMIKLFNELVLNSDLYKTNLKEKNKEIFVKAQENVDELEKFLTGI